VEHPSNLRVISPGRLRWPAAALKSERRTATRILWSFTGTGENTGTLPDGLFWFNHERLWQAIWESAVHRRAVSHKIEIVQIIRRFSTPPWNSRRFEQLIRREFFAQRWHLSNRVPKIDGSNYPLILSRAAKILGSTGEATTSLDVVHRSKIPQPKSLMGH
jgi:hypothetical protein